MSQYISNVIENLSTDTKQRVLFLTVGVSGSGKSYLCKDLQRNIAKTVHESCSLHSLDDYRVLHNGGRYPETKSEHDRVNAVAIPAFKNAVLQDKSHYIILDNTHLKWDPDWQLALQKAKAETMDLYVIMPPLTEYALFSNRSTHLSTGDEGDDIHLKMCARWSGNRFRHLINRKISHEVLDEIYPLSPDSFSVNKMFHVKWGSGQLYVLDNYLGYIDKNLVQHSIRAGNFLKAMKKDDIFLKKDSLLHVTIIKPKVVNNDILKQIAIKMSKSSRPPAIHYNGINELQQNGNKVIYLSISKQSQQEWKRLLDKTCAPIVKRGTPSLFNGDGLHVTLGFTNKDIWDVDKTVDPKWSFDFSKYNDIYEWNWRQKLTLEILYSELNYSEKFRHVVNEQFGNLQVEVPEKLQSVIGSLMCHPDVKCKWRWSTDTVLLNIQVTGPRWMSDDNSYKKSGKLMRQVPRGLTHVFSLVSGQKLIHINTVFPTAKFFGDNDLEEDVEVISDTELNAYGTSDENIITEKANGEMFTFTVCGNWESKDRNGTLVVMGSKNNKFPFIIRSAETIEKDIMTQVNTQLEKEGKPNQLTRENLVSSEWTNNNLWAEMCIVFARKLSTLGGNLQTFLEDMLGNNWTLCGEFESYLHPHLIPFEQGHQMVRFFAATKHDDDYNCEKVDALVMLGRLEHVARYSLDIVPFYSSKDNLFTIKDTIRKEKWKEGVVVLMVKNGTVTERVKLKTMWYVIHRGFREKIRKMLLSMKKSAGGKITANYVAKILTQTLKDKLAIFNLDISNAPEAKEYAMYITKMARYVEKSKSEEIVPLFLYDYPRLVQIVESS